MKLSNLLILIVCCALAIHPYFSSVAHAEIDPPDAHGDCHSAINDTIDDLVKAVAVEKTIPGMTIAVTKNGRLLCSKGYGYANWEEHTPMMPDSRAQIGSTTKVLTALAMMHIIQERDGIDLNSLVYGNAGILNHSDYTDAYTQGIRRHYPLAALAIGNNDRVLAWYTDYQYTVGNKEDLDKHAAPRPFTLPTGKTMTDLIGIARGGLENKVYSWYMDGSYSIGTPDDLDADFTYVPGNNDPKVQTTGKRNTIVGIAMNETGDKFYAYYHNGKVSSGSSPLDLQDRWVKEYSVPENWQRRYAIVGVARATDDSMFVWHSDNYAGKGNVRDLGADEGLFHYTSRITLDPAYWLQQIESIEIRHLLSHTSGMPGSGDPDAAAIRYEFEGYDKDTNPLPYELINRYVISTRPFEFAPGTATNYSNHGLGLVGHIIDELSGEDWYDYLRAHILQPLDAETIVPMGMYVDETIDANPHGVNGNGVITTKEMESRNNSASAAGSLKASAEDLTRIMVATDGLPNHPDILDADIIEQMETRPFPDIATGRAHGWQVECQNQSDCSDQRRLWHNGVSNGGTSYIAKYENYSTDGIVVDGINVAIVANRKGADTGRLRRLAKEIAVEVANSVILDVYDQFEPSGIGIEATPLDQDSENFKIYLPITLSE